MSKFISYKPNISLILSFISISAVSTRVNGFPNPYSPEKDPFSPTADLVKESSNDRASKKLLSATDLFEIGFVLSISDAFTVKPASVLFPIFFILFRIPADNPTAPTEAAANPARFSFSYFL